MIKRLTLIEAVALDDECYTQRLHQFLDNEDSTLLKFWKYKILKDLELTQLELQFLLTRALIVSKLNDDEAIIVTPFEEKQIPAGGCLLRFQSKDLMSL
jgi:hypothetical protein